MKASTKLLLIGGLVTAGILASTATPVSATSNNSCVDGSKRNNLSVTWNKADNISVRTAGSKPLCADVTVYFSSYTMPDNYNGQGFSNNPTASPQSIFDSKSAVLKKGTDGATTLAIKLPEECKNIQVDLYYAPEIKTVLKEGHGAQYITGKILEKTKDTCQPQVPEEPEVPEVPVPEAQTPSTPAPQVITPAQPAELPQTGAGLLAPIVLGAATYVAVRANSKRT